MVKETINIVSVTCLRFLIVRPNTDTRTISIYESFQANAKPFSWL